jgi:hypothetical protein
MLILSRPGIVRSPRIQPHRRRTGPKWLRGFGLLEVALLTTVVIGAVVAGLVAMRSVQESQHAESIEAQLRRANDAVVAFAAQHNRLPCPDTDGDGLEDATASGDQCTAAAGQKGWLPTTSLGLSATGSDPSSNTRLIYLVQREAADLARAQPERHNPPAFDTNTGQYSATVPLNQLATTDLCQGIANARSMPLAVTHAQADGHAVAYALVHPGGQAQSGAELGFEGLNRLSASGTSVEAPNRTRTLGLYDDRVWVQSYQGLSDALECDQLLAASRMLGFANEWVSEVNEQKQSTLVSSGIASTINLISSGVAALKTGLAVKGLVSAVSHLSAAATALAGAIASCVVLVGCALIPTFSAAVGTAIAAIAAYTATIALDASSLAASLVASGLSIGVAVQAGNVVGAGVDLTQVKADAQTNYNNAVTRRIDAQNRYNTALANRDGSKSTAYSNASSAVDSKVQAFVNHVNSLNDCGSAATDYGCTTPLTLATYQPQINAIRAATDTLVTKRMELADAQAALTRAQNAPPSAAPTLPSNPTVPSGVTPPSGATLPDGVRAQLVAARDAAQTAGDTEKVVGLNKAIEYLDNQQTQAASTTSAQRAADLTSQINEVQNQIDGYNTQILALDGQLAGTPCSPLPAADPQRQWCSDRDLLNQQTAQAITLKAALQEQLNQLSLDVTTASNWVTTKQAEVNAAETALSSAKNSLESSLSAMPYTTCTRGTNTVVTDPGPPVVTTSVPYSNCTVHYYNAIANDTSVAVLDANGNNVGTEKDYRVKVNQLVTTRMDWAVADKDVQAAAATRDRALQDEADALATVNALNNASSGTGLTVWNGAAQALQRADAKGGIQ